MSMEDAAQDHEVRIWEINNRPRPEAKKYAPGQDGYGPEECVECGDDMPALRRENGWCLCTACKAKTEATTGRR